jgi:amino acid permease
MTYEAIIGVMSRMNPILYMVLAISLTLVIVFRKRDRFGISRSIALACWYVLVLFSLLWLAFHVVDLFSQRDRQSGLTSVVYLISFLPVFLCAIIAAFMYPKARV